MRHNPNVSSLFQGELSCHGGYFLLPSNKYHVIFANTKS
ncbi:hypothetical protein B4110_0122 [Parageobacillus toebii]|uniref:Uncharacterized protein n=1 Tax=Parageobacillus toebii TaxID=153151 RepID=A0A150N8L4_9BACL|nr:hypothetical protein B4110_0122 [Parageobacillus toebii]